MKKIIAGKKVLIFSLVLGVLDIMAVSMVNQPEKEKRENNEKELPPEIRAEIERLFIEPIVESDIRTSRWSADKTDKRINIFVWKFTPDNKKFDRKEINGWKLNIIEDVELKEEIEKVDVEIKRRLKDNSASWLGGINPRTGGGKIVDVWVHELTPEAQELDGEVIHGWKINLGKSTI